MQQIDYISAIVFSSDHSIWMTQPLKEINAWLDQKGITHIHFKRILHHMSCYKLMIQTQALCLSISCTEGVNHYNQKWWWVWLMFALHLDSYSGAEFFHSLPFYWCSSFRLETVIHIVSNYFDVNSLISLYHISRERFNSEDRGQLCWKQNISTEKPN
jgi:hypothetical protein